MYHVNSDHKRARIAIMISDKIDYAKKYYQSDIQRGVFYKRGVPKGCNLIIMIFFAAS